MNITNIQIWLTNNPDDKLKALASITFDDALVIHGVKVLAGKEDLFVAMPSRKMKDGHFTDIFHPIKNDVREELSAKVIEAYNKALSENA